MDSLKAKKDKKDGKEGKEGKKDKKDKKEKHNKENKSEKKETVLKPPVIAAPVASKDKDAKKDKKDKKDKSGKDKKDKKEKKEDKQKTIIPEVSAPPAKKAKVSDDEDAGDFWDNDDFFQEPSPEKVKETAVVEEKKEVPAPAADAPEEVKLFPEEPQEVFDPLAPRIIALSGAEAKSFTDDARWLERVQTFAEGATIQVKDLDGDGAEATIEGGDADVIQRGFLCFKGMLAALQGDFVEVSPQPLPEAAADDPLLTVMDLPEAAGVSCVSPKKLVEAFEVIAAFVQEKQVAPPKPKPKGGPLPEWAQALGHFYGQAVEARYEDNWFHGDIVGFSSEGRNEIIIQWQGGGEDAQAWFPPVDVRPSKSQAPSMPRELRPGGRLMIFGGERARMAAALHVMAAVERKVPGHFSERNPPEETSALFGFGLKLFELPTDGGAVARLRSKIAAASEAIVEVIGKYAAVAGESDERGRAEALVLELVPHAGPFGDAAKVPDLLTEYCSHVRVPSVAVQHISGTDRADLNTIEDDTGTMAFWLPVGTEPRQRSVGVTVDIGTGSVEVGAAVKGKYEGEWYPATVVGAGSSGKVKLTWDFDGSEEEVPFAEVRMVKAYKERQAWLKAPRVLAIIGPERERRAAVLRVMAACEKNCPGLWSGYVSESLSEVRDGAEEEEVVYGVEAMPHEGTDADFEWATGPQGVQALRRAAAAASCAMEYIKRNLIFSGIEPERQRGAEYVRWIIQARREGGIQRSKLSISDADMREDISIKTVSEGRAPRLKPDKLWPIERETNTIALFDDGGGASLPQGHRRLLICGGDDASRKLAGHRIQAMLDAAGPIPVAESRSDDQSRSGAVEQPPAKVQKVNESNARSNPKEVLATMAWPASINQWGQLQKKIWFGHSQLPKGWIRVYSKSQDTTYFLRLKDMKTTFDRAEVTED